MFVKWAKTYRIIVPQVNVKGKHFLSDADTKKLLGGQVVLSEKIDGANVGLIRTKKETRLQKRSGLVGESEHEQFNALKAWSQLNYEKLNNIPQDSIIYGEWAWAKHTIYYDKLPDYFLAFAWLDTKTDTFKNWSDLEELCDKIGLKTTPFIAQGVFAKNELFDNIPDPSACGSEKAEGLIVYNHKNGMRGKVVREEFVKNMEESDHWTKYNIVKNKLWKPIAS
jgi:ribosomal protein L24